MEKGKAKVFAFYQQNLNMKDFMLQTKCKERGLILLRMEDRIRETGFKVKGMVMESRKIKMVLNMMDFGFNINTMDKVP